MARALALIEPEPSAVCIYPPCGLPAATNERGFPLCEFHRAQWQGWDDALA